MSYSYSPIPFVSTVNSTTTPLGGSATYTGTWEDITAISSVTVLGAADVAGTLWMDFSTDASNVDRQVQLSSGTTTDFGIHSLITVAQYYRVRVVNGSDPQAWMRVQVTLNPEARIAQPTSRLTQSLGNYSDVMNTRGALFGQTDGGDVWVPISAIGTAQGRGAMEVVAVEPTSAFGELKVIEPEPVAQADFVYGINNRLHTNATNSGIISVDTGMAKINTTAIASSNAQLQSIRYLRYRPGQGALGRWTTLFTTGVAGANQFSGLATPDMTDCFMFGYEGATFGIWHIKNGTRSHIPQSTWNIDRMDGAANNTNLSGMTLDPTKGNVYQVKYQYLGFGSIYFAIENSSTGQLTPVHEIQYTNTNTVPSVRQPSLNMVYRVENDTNDTDITLRSASYGLFLEGVRRYLGPQRTYENTKTSVTAETSIFTIRNATTYNGISNRALTRLRFITFAANVGGAAGTATLRLVRNASLGGAPSYTAIEGTTGDGGVTITDGQSTISVDTAGTTVTGGQDIYTAIIAEGTSNTYDVSNLDIFIAPGDILTLSAEATGSATVGISLVWSEDI